MIHMCQFQNDVCISCRHRDMILMCRCVYLGPQTNVDIDDINWTWTNIINIKFSVINDLLTHAPAFIYIITFNKKLNANACSIGTKTLAISVAGDVILLAGGGRLQKPCPDRVKIDVLGDVI